MSDQTPNPPPMPGSQLPGVQQVYSPYVAPSGTLMQAVRGPLMMITLGVLLTIDAMGGYTINHTWPIMLIVYGMLRLFERMEGTPSVMNS
jgi:hypothetical protein